MKAKTLITTFAAAVLLSLNLPETAQGGGRKL